jgi:hypothetical protein
MKQIFLFLLIALSFSMLISSCTKEEITGEIKEYDFPGNVGVSHYEYVSEPLIYIKVDEVHELFYINNNFHETYRRSKNYDSRYYLRWELTDSVAYIYQYRPDSSSPDSWFRVNVYTIYYTNVTDVQSIKTILDSHDILYYED